MAVMNDGFKTTISFSGAGSAITFEEKEVTPPGLSAGGAIDTSTMQNTTWRTMQPKALKTLSEATVVVAWDPIFYTSVQAMIGVNQSITITFPDLQTITFFGWVDEFTPNANVEGEQPTAEITIIPSNTDLAGVESSPVIA